MPFSKLKLQLAKDDRKRSLFLRSCCDQSTVFASHSKAVHIFLSSMEAPVDFVINQREPDIKTPLAAVEDCDCRSDHQIG